MYCSPSKQKCVRKLQLDPKGSLDEEQTSTSTSANMHARKNERTSHGRPTHTITEEAPAKPHHLNHLAPEGSLDEEQTSTSITAHLHTTEIERTPLGRKTHGIPAGFTKGKAPVEPNRQGEMHFNQLDPEGRLDKEQTSTSTTADTHTTEMEKTPQERQTHRITEGKGKPFVKECHEKIGTEGGKDKLDSFGIELQIPHGVAVDFSIHFSTNSLTNRHRLTKQGTSKASSSSSGNTNRQRQAVTDQQITKLAELLSSNAYSKLCCKLGIKYNLSRQILEKHRENYEAAYMEVLHQWKDKTGGPVKSLDKALHSCNVGGFVSEYKE